jgi:hypothetical protein
VFAHIDPALIEEKPWLGVVLGLAGAMLFAWMTSSTARDLAAMSRQQRPAPARIRDVRAVGVGQWIALEDARPQCARVLVVERRIPERWLFGRVEATEAPVADAAGSDWIVAHFDGAVDCAAQARAPLAGLIPAKGDHAWGSGAVRHRWAGQALAPRAILIVGAGPRTALGYVLFGLGMIVASLGLAVFCLRKIERRRRAAAAARLVSGDPITPE